MRGMFLRAAAVAALAASGGAAQAASINPTTYAPCLGLAACTIGDAMLSVTPGDAFTEQNFRGLKGLGVDTAGQNDTGANSPEIQGGTVDDQGNPTSPAEAVTIMFTVGQFIDELRIGQLYNSESFPTGNDPDEIARIEAMGANGTAVLEIQSLDETATGFTANDPSLYDSLARTNRNQGLFTLTGLFKDLGPITKLTFSAPSIDNVDTVDYSIAGLTTTAVPLPAPLFLLLGGLGALGYVGRRRRR